MTCASRRHDRPPPQRLSAEEVTALKFASHRQLARWAAKGKLSLHQQAQRAALVRAVRILQDKAFADGCELHVPDAEASADA